MIPATLSSGALHINVYTDLFFASYLDGAAAAMRYANFVVLTPLGIISNMILVPLLPRLSRLSAPESREELKLRIRQGLILTALTMLPLTAIFVSLALPIVQLIYQRYAFELDASLLVAPVLMTYGLGMFFYLGRDVLVRVFYALGDGQTPFRISLANIFLNAVLDYFLVNILGIPGLVLATVGVNLISMLAFLLILDRRLSGLPLASWSLTLLGLSGATVGAGLVGWLTSGVLQGLWGADNFWLLLLTVTLASVMSLGMFIALCLPLRLPELQMLANLVLAKLKKTG
jgi:putative peptidoglycan lipid II flippase